MFRPRPFFAAALLAAASALASPIASAEDMPHQLSAELIQTEHESCKTSTGYGVDFVRFVDIGGRKAVVLDYRAALCGGEPEPYCDGAGCLLKAYVSEKGSWRKVFEGRAAKWSIGDAGGRSTLLVDGRPALP